MKLTFLSAAVPLTKTYTKLPDGSIEKSSYPNIWEVTSVIEDCPNLSVFEHLLTKHGKLGHCLLKGMVMKSLVAESRANSTDRNATTEFICLDIDGLAASFSPDVDGVDYAPVATTIESILRSMGLGDVSYILQWSGSQGIFNNSLRCHIFIMLSKPVSAPLIKQWLIQKNHEVAIFKAHQALTKTGNALLWGLDVTACQSDKLIYIADPVLKGSIKNPLGKKARIKLVNKAQTTFDLTGRINSTDQNRALTEARVLELRDKDGLPKRKLTYKHVGGHDVLAKPGECIATEIKVDRGFVYFNLNGGDSWAYYHPENNPDYIFNFKGEPTYLTKELLPQYWETLQSQAYRVSSTGITYLAFLERQTSTYWRGTYDAAADNLVIHAAKNESMVRQFADSNGLRLGDNIPEWDMEFDPLEDIRVDFNNKNINTFQRTVFMKTEQPKKKLAECPPLTFKLISHILANDTEAIEHFINWLAYIVQQRDRTRTAWVFQGCEGTGKGLLMDKVLSPMFGMTQTVVKRAGELSEKWTDFVEGKLLVFIDEIQTSALKDEAGVIANLKNLITEPSVMVRVMNRNAFSIRNFCNWIFASNKADPVSVSATDRRFNIGPYQGTPYPRPTDAEVDALCLEVQAFYHYLETFACDKAAASTPLKNSARDRVIALSQTTSESTALALTAGNMDYFIDQLPTDDSYKLDMVRMARVDEYRRALCDVLSRTKPGGICIIKRDELFIMFNYTVGGMNVSPTSFTKFLGHRQIEIKPVSVGGKTVRGISVTWSESDKFAEHLKTHFNDMKVRT